MNLMTAMDVSATGMVAERLRLNVISMNLANAKTTKTETGLPYRRKTVVFRSRPIRQMFRQFLQEALGEQIRGVEVVRIEERGGDFKRIHDPSHPDADGQGYVYYPNVDPVVEQMNSMEALRAYEANIAAVEATKSMMSVALEMLA